MISLLNKFMIIAAIVASAIFAGVLAFGERELFFEHHSINGVNLVATNEPLTVNNLNDLAEVNANWVSIIPYAFSRPDQPFVRFNYSRQWYGEKTEGAIEAIKMAKEFGYKVMLKPHVWVRGEGWPGEYEVNKEEDWVIWEKDYSDYIMTYALIADSLDVDLLCIGTEFRKVVNARPKFWKDLIRKVKGVYQGPLTYAANWDNYENISFWEELDYIGIDAYFPLSKESDPSVENLMSLWIPFRDNLESFSDELSKPVVFTEYGYRSIDFCSKAPWDTSEDNRVNMQAQRNAYEALYRTFWRKDWFAGGFLWKWYPDHQNAGGISNSRFTPQNKHAQEVIRLWYGQ